MQPGETAQSFEAFRYYRDLVEPGVNRGNAGGGRHLFKVANHFGCSVANMERWSADHKWVSRAKAWDAHVARIEATARAAVIAETAEVWQRRRLEAAEADWQLSTQLRAKIEAMLAGMTDGAPLKMTPRAVANLAKLLAMVMQLRAAAMAEGCAASDDGFDPENATAEECYAYAVKMGAVKALPAPGKV